MSVSDTRLETRLRFNLSTTYRKTDQPTNPAGLKDNINYSDIAIAIANGRGLNKANLQYHSRRRLVNTTETLDLDGVLTNKWGEALNYDAVKVLVIRNRETVAGRTLQANFKSEQYNIEARGSRIIVEPGNAGIQAITESGSQEEGLITLIATGDVTYDIFAIGSDMESSSTSGA